MISVNTFRHPEYHYQLTDWQLWRDLWEGGEDFVIRYLKKWSSRESETDFERRRAITPVPGFAKSALVDIKNAVFHRMGDIVRKGGADSYQAAVSGHKGGVDRRCSGMNHFIGTEVLPELLSMGRVGVFVDNLPPSGPTLADARNASPYLYTYKVEDILSWQYTRPEEEGDFQVVLLRDWCTNYKPVFGSVHLPDTTFERYRLVWIGEDGYVWYQFFDNAGQPIFPDGTPGESPKRLELKKIPFVMFDIGQSLFKDISKHQVALLNLCSSDVSYALKANFPFYVEQADTRVAGSHLKSDVMEDGTATSGGQFAGRKEVTVGVIDGRQYGPNMEQPAFIAPPAEPLLASLKLQEKLENDIRKLVNLAVISLGNDRASGISKEADNQGLEAGLAFIGLVLEGGERKIANYWMTYEGESDSTVVIQYPEQYRMRSQKERIDEASQLTDLMFSIPGVTIKKELAKDAVGTLLGGRVTPDKMATINYEIDRANYATSNLEVIRLAKEQGLASDETLSDALGFEGSKEIPQAREDHSDRVARIQAAQTAADDPAKAPTDPGARGIDDLSVDQNSARKERQRASDVTTKTDTAPRTRGRGKNTRRGSRE